jgi:hypothetical protein
MVTRLVVRPVPQGSRPFLGREPRFTYANRPSGKFALATFVICKISGRFSERLRFASYNQM